MRYRNFVRAAAGVLATAIIAGGAFAQADQPQPQPLTMTDTAPSPAFERGSLGAVIMMDQPVLAQREALMQAQERSAVDTRTLGAGPARVLRDAILKENDRQRSLERSGAETK